MKKAALLLIATLAALPAQADTVSVAAAADLLHCLPKLNQAFANAHPGSVVKFTPGASGNFFAQIKAGAPFDVFLSADTDYPRKLVEAGQADHLTPYAQGRIALWTRKADLDPSVGLKLIADARVQRFAIANPAVAPYGRAAKAALERAGLWNDVQPKLVQGENIAQTAQYVQSGNADAGIVSYSLLKAADAPPGGRYWLVPANLHPPIAQAGVVTKQGSGNPLAAAYLAMLTGPQGKQVLAACGFDEPK